MIDTHTEALRDACALALACPKEAILWDGEPEPNAGDLGFLVTLSAKLQLWGSSDERRQTLDAEGLRVVTVHHARQVTVTFEVKSFDAKVSAPFKLRDLLAGLSDEGPAQLLDAAKVGYCQEGASLDLSFAPDGKAFGRAVGEVVYNVTWDRLDLTASRFVIESVTAIGVEPL